MPEPDEQRADRRETIIAAYTLVSIVTGIPAYFEYMNHTEMLFMTSGLPAWVYVAAAVSSTSAILSYLTIAGHVHRPPRSDSEIVDEIVGNGE